MIFSWMSSAESWHDGDFIYGSFGTTFRVTDVDEDSLTQMFGDSFLYERLWGELSCWASILQMSAEILEAL